MASRPFVTNQPTKAQRGYKVKPVRLPLDRKYICPEGDHILKNPVQAGCGERFCRECADSLLRQSNPHCPVCSEPMKKDEVFRDAFAERETLALEVFCECKDDGCDWQGALRDYEAHQLNCLHRLVPCPNGCGEMVAMTTLERHQNKECSQRPVECSYCHMRVAASMLDTHNRDQCQYQPVTCSYCSAGPMPRDQMEGHLNSACPSLPVLCPYSFMGCPEKIPRRSLDQHMTAFTQAHLDLVVKAIAARDMQSDQQKREAERQRRNIQELVDNFQDQAKKMAEIKASLSGAASSSATGAVHPAASTSMNETQKLVRQLTERLETAESRMKSMEQKLLEQGRTLTVHDIQAADLNLRADILDVKTTNGVLIWKIGDVGRRRREAISGRTPSLYSAPFYTSPAGYKMCARIYLDGDGMGKGSCISLFFVLMKGEYDSLLVWPFQLRVTMILMDQSEPGPLRRNITEVFRPDQRSASFKQPVSEMNTGSGCPMFAPVSVLDSSTSVYVKEDTIFIKLIVDTKAFTAPDSERL